VTPILKKPGMDTSDMASYRPLFNLSFLSKTVERIVAKQLSDYVVSASLLPPLQFCLRIDVTIPLRRHFL